jgi:hypothetical protein
VVTRRGSVRGKYLLAPNIFERDREEDTYGTGSQTGICSVETIPGDGVVSIPGLKQPGKLNPIIHPTPSPGIVSTEQPGFRPITNISSRPGGDESGHELSHHGDVFWQQTAHGG